MIKKNDFVEIDFTARIKETDIVFDTTLIEDAKKANLPTEKIKPLRICIGQGMIILGLDKALEEKEIGKKYALELKPKDAFGERNAKLIKVMPLKVFTAKEIVPIQGMMLTLDDMLARISAVSGGRVIVDFNNPLAGKEITYTFTIRRQITQEKEKIATLASFYLKEEPFITLKESKKAEIKLKNYNNRNKDIFIKKVRELLGIDVLIIKSEKEQKAEKEQKVAEQHAQLKKVAEESKEEEGKKGSEGKEKKRSRNRRKSI